jgi:hypothetical protein
MVNWTRADLKLVMDFAGIVPHQREKVLDIMLFVERMAEPTKQRDAKGRFTKKGDGQS